MASVAALRTKIDNLLAHIEQQEDIPDIDIEARISLWVREGLTRKLEVWLNPALSREEKHARCLAIWEEIDARKTPAERIAEARYHKKHPCEGAREQLKARIMRIRDAREDQDQEEQDASA